MTLTLVEMATQAVDIHPGASGTWCWHCHTGDCHQCGWNHRDAEGALLAWRLHEHKRGAQS